tara:strand:- start:13269 stop:14219 length:951 start_codon:yes stop_codon:yes gene_type:complete
MSRLTLIFATLALAATVGCSDSSDSQPIQPLLSRYILSSDDSVPEGIAFDPVERAFYVTSLQGASIVRVAAGGEESIFRPADNRALIGGAKIDADARRLWVCAQAVDGMDSRVWVYDLESAELELEFLLGALTTDASCNDLALDADGIAYVTDPANPFIYRLDAGSGEGEILATDPLFNDLTGAGLGLNGIAVTPAGDALIVAKFIPAGLLRVSLPDGDSITQVTLAGDALPSPDGLVFFDGDLYAVSGEAVSRIRPEAGFNAAAVTVASQVSGLSTATLAGDDIYVVKSEVVNFVLGAPLEIPFEIFRLDLSAFE